MFWTESVWHLLGSVNKFVGRNVLLIELDFPEALKTLMVTIEMLSVRWETNESHGGLQR